MPPLLPKLPKSSESPKSSKSLNFFKLLKLFKLPFEFKMAYFLTFRGRSGRDGFLSFISILSAAGIALGVAALIIILSVMNGFQKEVRDRMLSVISHVEVQNFSSSLQSPLQNDFNNFNESSINRLTELKTFSQEHQQQVSQLLSPEQINFTQAPFAKTNAMLLIDQQMQGVILQGIDPQQEQKVSAFLKPELLQKLHAKEFGVLIGKPLADYLDYQIGSQINLAIAEQEIGPLGITPTIKAFTIVGIYESGHYEYDRNLIITHIEDELAMAPNSQIGLKLKLPDLFTAPHVAMLINQNFAAKGWQATPWSEQNKTWFAAVKTEKTMMFIILTLIIAVAAFNLVSGLVMNVKDKQGQIAILVTFGAKPSQILGIFMLQGLLIGLIGLLLGVGFGSLIAYHVSEIVGFLEQLLNVEFLPKQIYLISKMPSDPHLQDILLISGFSFLISILATIYPSLRASRLKPTAILRME